MKKSKIQLTILLGFILIVVVGLLIFNYSKGPKKKPLYWVDAMEPNIHYPGPGKSRMNMELTPVYDESQILSDEDGSKLIKISPIVINNLGIRTEIAAMGPFERRIDTVGYVEPNEDNISHVHTYAEGWIKKLVAKETGAFVKKGQLLFQLYSPFLLSVQEEYINTLNSNDAKLSGGAYQKLRTLGVSEKQIDHIKQTRKRDELIDVYATQDGIIANLNVREGMKVTPETEIMSLFDLSNVWIMAEVLEQQASWMKAGEEAEASLTVFPGKIWKGKVEYVYPQADPVTRTIKVRIQFDNLDNILKPNMYANVTFLAAPKENILSVPTQAIIRGSKENHVIVKTKEGYFKIKTVTIGNESGERTEILSGLSQGEEVVTSGQFLIDSEANLKANFDRMESP